jgi:hypothetical protein
MRWHALAAPLAAAAFLVNPSFGCGTEDFDYGPAEMRALAEGTWEFSVPGETTPRLAIRLAYGSAMTTERPGFIRRAAACGNRQFVAAANACVSTSSMVFGVQVVRSEAPFASAPVDGSLVMFGSKLASGTLTVRFVDGGNLVVGVGADGASPKSASLQTAAEKPLQLSAVRRP